MRTNCRKEISREKSVPCCLKPRKSLGFGTPDRMHEASWSDAKGSSTWKRPRHADQAHSPAKQEVPIQIGTQDTTHREQAQHVCLLKRLLGALSWSIPSNTFPLEPPIYCRQDPLLEIVGNILSAHRCHTQPCKSA